MSKVLVMSMLLGLALGGSACTKMKSAGGPASGAAAVVDPKAPMAKVGGQVITAGDLAEAIKPRLTKLEADHAEKVYQLKSEALDDLVEKRLIEAKAKREGLTSEKLIEREVKPKDPSDAEIQQVYDRAKASGRQVPPFEQVKGEIAKMLKDRSSGDVRKTFVDKLKSDAKVEILLPPLRVQVAAEGPAKGDAKAPITIVEFSDFECPFCSRAEDSVKKVLAEYKGKVRLVYRDYPLPFHSKAQKASEAALCAGDQGKYWEMHEKLFSNQQALEVTQLKEHAKGLGLDGGKFDKCLDSGEKAPVIEASKKAGEEAGVNGTPAFFINGRVLSGAQPFEEFKKIIDSELAGGG
jgi:protein-disulfide isomerase